MEITIKPTKVEMGEAAAEKAAFFLKDTIQKKGKARFIAATGASQFEFLDALVKKKDIDWSKTEMFHLDEYVGIPDTHGASFRKYLKERLVNIVNPGSVNFVEGDSNNVETECQRLGNKINENLIDVAFVGIGENGHLAFNDPPADFEIEDAYIIVDLDEKCRMQQVGEGWFKNLAEVPTKAISMTIKQIMKAENIICTVPDARKAEAVHNCLSKGKEVTNMYPSSILKNHKSVFVYLDQDSASQLIQ